MPSALGSTSTLNSPIAWARGHGVRRPALHPATELEGRGCWSDGLWTRGGRSGEAVRGARWPAPRCTI